MAEPTGDLLGTDGTGTEDNQTTTTQTQNWYSDEYKDVVTQKGWSSANDTLKSYTELEKAMGGRIKVPTPESSAEEVSAFYAKIGRPENPDGYEIADVPENITRDENMESLMRKVAFDSGIPKVAFETQIKKYYEAMSQTLAQAKIEGENALKGDWKDKYDTNLEIAKRFAQEGGDEFVKWLKDTGVGNLPVVIKAFFTYGTKTLSDSLIQGDGVVKKDDYRPKYPDSPAMYASGDDEESQKGRAWHEARGYHY